MKHVVFLGLLVSCGGSGGGSDAVSGPGWDTCNNGLGNGAQIISGPSGPSGQDYDQPFRSLAVDPTNPNIVFVGTERNGICKSTDGGQTWQRLRYGIRHDETGYPEAWDLSIHPSGSAVEVFLAMTGGPLPIASPNANAGVYRSTDGGLSWSRSNCGISNHKGNSILHDPNNPSVLILGIEGGLPSGTESAGQYQDGGLYRSTNGGTDWVAVALPAGANKQGYWHLRARGSPVTTFTTFAFNYDDLSENLGFLRSTNGGQTWSQFAPALRPLLITGFDLSADGQTLYANVRDSFEMQKSTDGGANWTAIPSNANGPVRVSPTNANRVLFGDAGTPGNVYLSTDGLATPATLKFTASRKVMDIEFAPSNPNIVYASSDGYEIWRSGDGGDTWSPVANLRTTVLTTP